MDRNRGLPAILAAAVVTTTMLASAAPQAVVGTIQWNRAWTNLNQTLTVTVTDADLNQNASEVEITAVNVTSLSDATGFTLTLAETGVDTGVFEATIQMSDVATDATNAGDPAGSPRPRIRAADGDVITARYPDASEGNASRTAQVAVEPTPPTFSNLSPAHKSFTNNSQVTLSVDVTDSLSGVNGTTIKFFMCKQSADCTQAGNFNEVADSDSVFDDDPTTGFGFHTNLYAIIDITGGKRASVLVELVDGDGTYSWYGSANDNAGNIGQSKADPELTTLGAASPNTITLDRIFLGLGTFPAAITGQWWDSTKVGAARLIRIPPRPRTPASVWSSTAT